MTTYTYYPKGTCSKQMEVDLEDGVIKDVRVLGGCNGNLQGISSLVRGMKATDAIERMRGIRCGFKPTSCPDQLSIALEKALEEEKTQSESHRLERACVDGKERNIKGTASRCEAVPFYPFAEAVPLTPQPGCDGTYPASCGQCRRSRRRRRTSAR